jgi:hypothetical protein
MEDTKAAIKQAIALRNDSLKDRLPTSFLDEIEITPWDDGTDPITSPLVELAVVDLLREQETWDQLDEQDPIKDPDTNIKLKSLLSRPEFRLAIATCTLAHDIQTMTDATLRVTAAFTLLKDLEHEFPEAAPSMLRIVQELLRASYSVAKSTTLASHTKQRGSVNTLSRVKARNDVIKKRAQELANKHWQTDTHQKLSVIDVAEAVRKELSIEGVPTEKLVKASSMKKWLAPSAPAYARRPGRR